LLIYFAVFYIWFVALLGVQFIAPKVGQLGSKIPENVQNAIKQEMELVSIAG